MPYPVTGGAKNYSSQGANNTSKFIPQVWSSKLVTKFYTNTVYQEIANTDYEGEIKDHGDSVIIRTRPDITVSDYVKGQSLNYQQPESANVQLDIDQGHYFAFELKDIDRYQSDLKLMDEWADDGSQQMKIKVDRNILGSAFTGAHSLNAGTTAGKISGDINLGSAASPLALTKTNIIDQIVNYGTVLDEHDIPESQRYVILPAKACAMIKTSELKDASLSGDGTSTLRNGKVGMLDRFTIYSSNQVNKAGGEYDIMFGHKSALTFAGQITNMETLKNTDDFGDLARSLFVYGFEVIKPDALGHSVITL